jgi:predicted  nucleic acid-binding Zn-ribbon protein
LRDAYRQLSQEEREGSTGAALLAQITPLDAKLKEIDATIGNHQRKVGDYEGAIKKYSQSFVNAFNVLEKELQRSASPP